MKTINLGNYLTKHMVFGWSGPSGYIDGLQGATVIIKIGNSEFEAQIGALTGSNAIEFIINEPVQFYFK